MLKYTPVHEIQENIGSYDIEDIEKAYRKAYRKAYTVYGGVFDRRTINHGWCKAFGFLANHLYNYGYMDAMDYKSVTGK